MIDNPEGRPPAGRGEANSVEHGEPAHEREARDEALRQEPRPNLDEREDRISTRRKPMGPPLPEPEEPREDALERRDEQPSEPPVDPD
jgi:hypothetical protein